MKLSKDEVAHLAELARLKLDESQIDKMTAEVGSILEYVESIQKVDVAGVEPFSMPAKSQGFRPDEAFDCDDLTRELILENFPGRAGDLLAAPGVFSNPKN
ncbi:MAG: Asp-tRNA(Asn)/Glu-tRNA(Gln) amidotransferase subunit GatC [Patescibacteria group bacterium]|nr:Asp-tRNA(Asn)/Glu-tRNA(Gln) amidotransferase subunit GatC [Patescibacteria group bacterium]